MSWELEKRKEHDGRSDSESDSDSESEAEAESESELSRGAQRCVPSEMLSSFMASWG